MKSKILILILLLFLFTSVSFATENITATSNNSLKENNAIDNSNNKDILNENNNEYIHTENVTIYFDENKLNNTSKTPSIYLTQDCPEYSGEIGGLYVNITKYSKYGYTGHLITIKANTSLYLNFNSYAFERGVNNTYTYEMLYGNPIKNTISNRYSPYKTYFTIYDYPSENLTNIPHPDNQYRLIPTHANSETATLYYADIELTTFKFYNRYVSKTYISSNNTFELEIYPYVAESSVGDAFYVIKYNDTKKIIILKDNEKFNSTISYNGWFRIDIYKKVDDYTPIKQPVYNNKKVKNGYKLKFQKTKWHKTKIVTHKLKQGKLIAYHNKLRKIRNLVNKNGKIMKTVYGAKKTTVYLKYPVDYYKKVRKYKYIPKLVGYNSSNVLTGFHYEFEKFENRKYI